MSIIKPEPGNQNFTDIRFIVPICVFKEEHIRGMSQNHSPPGESHGCGNIKAIGKDRKLIRLAVPISVFTYFNAVLSFTTVLKLIGIIHRFHNPESSAFVPLKINRVHNIRLRRKELEFKSHRNLSVLHAFLRGKR